jgi:hypothetical protein
VPTTQIFDDGSSVTYDDAGNVISVVNSAGVAQYAPPTDGSAIVQQFASLFTKGIQAVANSVAIKLQGSLSGAAAPGTPASQAKPNYTPLLLIGGGIAALALLTRK